MQGLVQQLVQEAVVSKKKFITLAWVLSANGLPAVRDAAMRELLGLPILLNLPPVDEDSKVKCGEGIIARDDDKITVKVKQEPTVEDSEVKQEPIFGHFRSQVKQEQIVTDVDLHDSSREFFQVSAVDPTMTLSSGTAQCCEPGLRSLLGILPAPDGAVAKGTCAARQREREARLVPPCCPLGAPTPLQVCGHRQAEAVAKALEPHMSLDVGSHGKCRRPDEVCDENADLAMDTKAARTSYNLADPAIDLSRDRSAPRLRPRRSC